MKKLTIVTTNSTLIQQLKAILNGGSYVQTSVIEEYSYPEEKPQDLYEDLNTNICQKSDWYSRF